MKRLTSILALTTALAVAPAMAGHHGDKPMKDTAMNKDVPEMAEKMAEKPTKEVKAMKSEVLAQRAAQAFLAMDTSDDGKVSKAEWADWQERGKDTAIRFEIHDIDDDQDLEFSEYYMAVSAKADEDAAVGKVKEDMDTGAY